MQPSNQFARVTVGEFVGAASQFGDVWGLSKTATASRFPIRLMWLCRSNRKE